MRKAWVVAVLVVVSAGLVVWWLSGSDDPGPPESDLTARTARAGAVEVTMTPLGLDSSGAAFRVVMDTHSVELDLDVASAARLSVDGAAAGPATWDGAGPGGHHREGTLRFAAPVPPGAAVRLRLTGLPADVTATWTAP